VVASENGKYWCTYEVLAVTDEMRELANLKLYESENPILTLANIPGSDVEITNSGKLVFYDHSEHFLGKLKLHIYSKEGAFLFTKEFEGVTKFGYSPSGEMMGIPTLEGILVISLNSGSSYLIEKGLEFAIDLQNEFVAVTPPGKLMIYKNSISFATIQTGMEYPRMTAISTEQNIVGVIDKFYLKIYSLNNCNLIFEDKISADLSFRDLRIVDDKILAGIHKRNNEESTGFLRIFDLRGYQLEEIIGDSRQLQKFKRINLERKPGSSYDPIPWPFFPFDSMRTVWNHYEQNMGLGGTNSYLHQALDFIAPIGEPTYSVIDGYVKSVFTIGGTYTWFIAISPEQIPGWSNGWLYLHLIQNTIQFSVGDTVHIHDYLGNIIQWSADWAHLHFVEVRDSGTVWPFTNNGFGINFNPALVLTPYPDVTPPNVEPVFTWSKFAFAQNETATYLQPDSIYGEIDIIVKVADYVGASQWQQPAFTTWYTIKRLSNGEIIKPRTLGHILNHSYPSDTPDYMQLYAGVIYQRDNILPPPDWMNMQRNFYHNLTNSNGDSLIELSEKTLAFNTASYDDGDYRIIVEVYDEAGNFDIDSMDVKFVNSPNEVLNEQGMIYSFNLYQNCPNPFNPSTVISYQLPVGGYVTLEVFDVLGNKIATLVDEYKTAGTYEVEFNTSSIKHHPSSGVYFYQMRAGDYVNVKKMLLLK
jgi:murein DD-endopeptidase MepM/ murein hydrolase activator NlpD